MRYVLTEHIGRAVEEYDCVSNAHAALFLCTTLSCRTYQLVSDRGAYPIFGRQNIAYQLISLGKNLCIRPFPQLECAGSSQEYELMK